ncbi:thiamine phosphate synthase [Clostridium hydrogenum]|uniref:thiamine phosphate synthase n=1 Tax=Clostridium hydrogenum TaxID=2855764 RepID=UPI001F28DA66|nr:thiamine phosphate synthase [Clostridium hydrogenum]
MKKIDYSLYLVTERSLLCGIELEAAVEKAILGGTTLVQLREKNLSTKEFYDIAVNIKKVTDKYKVPLIINDRLDIALAVHAAGIHVGQSDMPCDIARKFVGENKIVGVSAHTVEEALKAQKDGADYLGVGAVFTTGTKKDAEDVSIETLKEIVKKVNIPVVAIGGVSQNNVDELAGTGINGIAVISAILGKKDIEKAAEDLKRAVKTIVNKGVVQNKIISGSSA